jgi:glycogen debranching enzyme
VAENLIVMRGSTFFVSDSRGDVLARAAEGFFTADVRHLSTWRLLLDGRPMFLLTSRTVAHDRALIFGTLANAHIGHSTALTVTRDRRMDHGFDEKLTIESHDPGAQSVVIDLCFGSDFIDIFEARGRGSDGQIPREGRQRLEADARSVRMSHEQRGFRRHTQLTFDRDIDLVGEERARFEVDLGPRGRWELGIHVSCEGDGITRPRPTGKTDLARTADPDPSEAVPVLETDDQMLRLTYAQSVADLNALRLPSSDGEGAGVPAAGLPWFMTVFGRDSLITAYQTLPFMPRLASSTLRSLAALQARGDDGFRDAEPGKILHELRRGKLATLGKVPHTPYYGTHDATPLFLILLDEYERWTGDAQLIAELEEPARRALEWLQTYGDPDGDGYLEYHRRSPLGLRNQCWKDSDESVVFADGRRARGPLALCEIQGYAFDAYVRVARLARAIWADEALAEGLESRAATLKERFNADFWCEERGHYVLALDGDKEQVDSLTSNTGHLLWSGIIDETRAGEVTARLMADDMFNGWGVRTLCSSDGAYNPIGYHIGTVWPHDSGIAAEGMRRYGYRAEASRLTMSLLEAATFFGHRLPEVFAGFDRGTTGMPVEYPTASRPQAWASGATLLALRTLLGMDPIDGDVRAAPVLPDRLGLLRVRGVLRGSARVDVSSGA